MGVAGLWDVLKPAAKIRSLTELAVKEGFQSNPKGLRGYRIGIDASIWFFHAEYGKEGENPVLRTLFFRCATLMKAPFLPLFVFDGPKRPDFKRGKRINKSSNKLITGMKTIVEAFGFEWRMAPGEAEAELAYLNRIGVIDGILSDDVDNFLFGALTVIRNQSNNLSGNKANPVVNSEGKDDKNHTRVFRLQDIRDHEDIQLSRGGLILIGLLSGGDYEEGLQKCGMVTAHALARCGFGDTLFEAANKLSRDELPDFLHDWRKELRRELKTNSKGFLKKRLISLSNSIPDTFPNIDVLLSYAQPITSESLGHTGRNPTITWSKEPNFAILAAACELYFEWGYKEAIIKRFRTVIWPGAVLRILRRAVLDVDQISASQYEDEDYRTPSKMIAKHFSSMRLDDEQTSDENDEVGDLDTNLIVSISLERNHASTDKLLEYRVEVAPAQLVQLAESGLKGLRQPEGPNEWASDEEENGDDEDEEGGRRKGKRAAEPVDPGSHLRLWMPACMVDIVEKNLVKSFQDKKERKKQKKKAPSRKKAASTPSQVDPFAGSPTKLMKVSETSAVPQGRTLNEFLPQTPSKRQPQRFPLMEARKEEEEESTGDEGELPVVPGIPFAKRSAPVTTQPSSSRPANASRVKGGAKTLNQRDPQPSYPSLQTIEDTLAFNSDDEDELPVLTISQRPVPVPTKHSSFQSVSTSKVKQIANSSRQRAPRSKPPFSRMVSASSALTSEDEDELPILYVKPSIPIAAKTSSSRYTSTSKIHQVAAIFGDDAPSSSLPSSRVIDKTLALSDSEEELPADAYQTVQPKKISKANKIEGYVSLSDDEDHKRLPPPARRTQKNNKKPTQTTISSYIERDGCRDPSLRRDESSDNQQIPKSPRKSRKQTSPRHLVINISDEDSDIGYTGSSQLNVAPLQLARARKAATPIPSRARSTNVDDIIDLT